MPGYNGAGIWDIRYNFVTDAANGIKILASRQDQMWGDVKASFQNVLTLDGQTKPTANIDWGGLKIVNLGDGSAAQDAVTFKQLNTNLSAWILETNAVLWVSATQVRFPGIDLTPRYLLGRKVAFKDNGVAKYGYVTAVSFVVDTFVTIATDDASVMVGPTSEFHYSIADPRNLPNPVLSTVSAHSNASLNFASGVNKVPFQVEDIDTLGEYDPTSGVSRFTAIYTGRYLVTAHATMSNLAAVPLGMGILLYKNGAPYATGSQASFPAANGVNSSTVSAIVFLQTAEFLEIFASSSVATNNIALSNARFNVIRLN
jgi:hypothetical protein